MQLLVWEDRFSVGVREFDQHHKILFEMINSLIIAQEDGRDTNVIGNTLEQLQLYTVFHFTAEEAMLKHFNFEGLDEHRTEHATLLGQVEAYQKLLIDGQDISIDEMLVFVSDWLLDHTLGMDQLYSKHLSGKLGY